MRQPKPLLTAALVASLLGSSIAWALVLSVAPLGAYDVDLHLDDGRFAVVLDRRAPADRTPGLGDPATNDGDGLHDEYVVTLETLDVFSTADSGKSAKLCGPAVVITQTIDVTPFVTPIPSPSSARPDPLPPASFSILRL